MAQRLSWSRAFFADLRLTSKLKHLVLQRYVKEFAYHLGSKRSSLYYVDGFAGPGTYGGAGSKIEKGSPLLVAELGKQIHDTKAAFTLKCLNVEEDRRHHADLEAAAASFVPDIVEKNYLGSFTEAPPSILDRIGDAPAFFFIDPLGTKGLPFRAIRPIFQRFPPTEVLITFHTDGIAKKAGRFASVDDPNPRRALVARKHTEVLAEALNLPWDTLRGWWRECVQEGRGGTPAFEERVLARYVEILRGPATRFQFTKTFPVFYYRPDAPPGIGAPICFNLVFATQHKMGLYKMNDCMVDALDRFYEDEYGHTFFPQFRQQIDKAKDLMALKTAILARFSSRPFTIDQVKQTLMQEARFLVRGAEYSKAVRELSRAQHLHKLDGGPINNETTRFAVGSSPPKGPLA